MTITTDIKTEVTEDENLIKKYVGLGIDRENIQIIPGNWIVITVPLLFRNKYIKKVWEEETKYKEYNDGEWYYNIITGELKDVEYNVKWYYNITTGELGYERDGRNCSNSDDYYINSCYIKVIDDVCDGKINIIFSDVPDNEIQPSSFPDSYR